MVLFLNFSFGSGHHGFVPWFESRSKNGFLLRSSMKLICAPFYFAAIFRFVLDRKRSE